MLADGGKVADRLGHCRRGLLPAVRVLQDDRGFAQALAQVLFHRLFADQDDLREHEAVVAIEPGHVGVALPVVVGRLDCLAPLGHADLPAAHLPRLTVVVDEFSLLVALEKVGPGAVAGVPPGGVVVVWAGVVDPLALFVRQPDLVQVPDELLDVAREDRAVHVPDALGVLGALDALVDDVALPLVVRAEPRAGGDAGFAARRHDLLGQVGEGDGLVAAVVVALFAEAQQGADVDAQIVAAHALLLAVLEGDQLGHLPLLRLGQQSHGGVGPRLVDRVGDVGRVPPTAGWLLHRHGGAGLPEELEAALDHGGRDAGEPQPARGVFGLHGFVRPDAVRERVQDRADDLLGRLGVVVGRLAAGP